MNVLLVERDRVACEAIFELLQLEWPDMQIYSTDNGAAGLDLAKEHDLDLILLAYSRRFEGGFDDVDVASAFRHMAESKSVPLIAIIPSSFAGSATAVDLIAKCNAWLLKPFSAERLYQVVSPFALTTV